jgi:GxxExxY protein
MNEPQRHRASEDERRNALTSDIIGAAIEVHRVLGPGLLESMYETALCVELEARGLSFARQVVVPAYYKGRLLGDYKVDLIVEDRVVVEVKSVVAVAPVLRGSASHVHAPDQQTHWTPHQLPRAVAEGRDHAKDPLRAARRTTPQSGVRIRRTVRKTRARNSRGLVLF